MLPQANLAASDQEFRCGRDGPAPCLRRPFYRMTQVDCAEAPNDPQTRIAVSFKFASLRTCESPLRTYDANGKTPLV
jgi:hypothetical protein